MKRCKNETIISIVICAVTAFCFLLLCSRSSFLYCFNNWDDANSYFSMGKLMMNGGVIYRDLFDQKGPLLYFLYGIGYLLSNTTFHGVFLLEVLALSVVLTAAYRFGRLYAGMFTSLFAVVLLALGITVSKSFYWGGSAEEFCLPFMAVGLYISAKYFKEEYPKNMSVKTVFLCGIMAGCIMTVKYTGLGFYFAFMGMIALMNLNRKNWKGSIRNCFIFLAGMVTPAVPWLFYFGIHGALDDWYQCYVYCNVFLYSDFYVEKVSLGEKLYNLAKILYWLIWDNAVYFLPMIAGFVYLLFSRKYRWYEKINLYALFGFLFLGIYVGGTTLFYYSLPLTVLSVPGFLCIAQGIVFLVKKILKRNLLCQKKVRFGALAAVLLFSLCTARMLSMNTEYQKQDKENLFLYEFTEIVKEEENPTLLNIGCLDAGLYTMADIMPTCRYFQSNAVHGFDEVALEQTRYIKEGQTSFVLARNTYPEEIWEKYELVCERDYQILGADLTYYLFRRK
ncbi:MAG: glycosyltransferase family 39 protein [Lachnospiraceae bacterium]|nr:glycosyltransferase family 39 protein [Lachnospiraceae bacterium]